MASVYKRVMFALLINLFGLVFKSESLIIEESSLDLPVPEDLSVESVGTRVSDRLATSVMVVLAESGVQIPCMSNQDKNADTILRPSFQWKYHGEPGVHRAGVDIESGELILKQVSPEQAGVYECWVTGYDHGGHHTTRVFGHELVVYTLPDVVLEQVFIFSVPRCARIMDVDIVEQYTAKLCRPFPASCPFSVAYNCSGPDKRVFLDELERDLLMMSVNIRPSPDFQPPLCNLQCVRLDLATHLYDMKVKAVHDWTALLEEEDHNALKWYAEVPTLGDPRVVETCPVGSGIYGKSVCAACFPGHYWRTDGLCEPCPANTYSTSAGSRGCERCAGDHVTAGRGATSARSCHDRSRVRELMEWSREDAYVTVGVVLVVVCVVSFIVITVYLVVLRCWDYTGDELNV